jgi:hypothetical protein
MTISIIFNDIKLKNFCNYYAITDDYDGTDFDCEQSIFHKNYKMLPS